MRIASLLPAATDWVHVLGASEQLVGCSHGCAVGERDITVLTKPAFDASGDSVAIDGEVHATLEQGLSLYEVDIEALKEARPDVVLTQAQCSVCAVSTQQIERVLADWTEGRPTVVSFEPKTLKQVLEGALRIARAIDRMDAAMSFIAEKEQSLRHLHQQLEVNPKTSDSSLPSVVCIEWFEPLMVAGHWTPDIIRQAGGRKLLSASGERSERIGWEVLREADPDVLFLAPCGFTLDETRRDLHYLTERNGWQELSAVSGGRVFAFDGSRYFNMAGPQVYRAIELAAYGLYRGRLLLPSIEPEEWEMASLSSMRTGVA